MTTSAVWAHSPVQLFYGEFSLQHLNLPRLSSLHCLTATLLRLILPLNNGRWMPFVFLQLIKIISSLLRVHSCETVLLNAGLRIQPCVLELQPVMPAFQAAFQGPCRCPVHNSLSGHRWRMAS